ncbi:Pentatricopeptide repeat-containing protein [Thalictrum thalictroides]|uniref:Pentatricopeptide repeat-containing protein n=1 Tax=Thalictrum thalictroides TaxID=46969 RepID=A0A7J6XCZ3_THATH|nr:Pentatricopeptide repeat-containing protein [Thalictrum thalictroides]
MEACCLHIVVSTKIPPLIGVSGGVGNISKLREQKFVETPSGASKRVCRVYRKSQTKRSSDVVSPSLDFPTLVKNPSQEQYKVIGGKGVKGDSNGAINIGLESENSSQKKQEAKSSSKWVSQNRSSESFVSSSLDCPTLVKSASRQSNKSVHREGNVKNRGVEKFELKHGKLSEQKRYSKSLSKWSSYGGCLPLILQALDTVEDLDEALNPWEMTLNNKERSIILKEQVNCERALEIFNWFKGKGCYELNVIHYNIMLRILGKARRWDHVEKIWSEMQTKRIAPTNSTYGTLIDVYGKGGLKEEALLWLERMNKQGMEPDEVTMGIVVQTYKKSGEFEKAEQFFKKWSSGTSVSSGGKTTNTSSVRQASFSSYTYNTLIDTYGKAGQLQDASDTFSRMLREGSVPTTVTFNTMIHICGNNGQLEEVDSLMKMMEELRCPPDTRTYNILISLHAKHDKIDVAASYFSKMKKNGLKPDYVSYRTLLYAFSIRHMVSEAEALISEMDKHDFKVDEYTQSALTRMFIEAGMLQKAWSWFERYHLVGKISSECYSANMDAFGEHGHVLEAEKVFICCQKMNKLSVFEFNVMIKAYGIGKKYDKVCELFDTMEKHGVVPDNCSYNSLIQILSGADLPHLAKPYVRKMQEAGLVLDCIPYSAVISGFIKLGQLDMAEKQFKEMVEVGVQPDIYVFGILINAFADVGSVQPAMNYVNEMKNSGLPENPVIYNSLIKLYTKIGYLQEAEETYKQLRSSEASPEVYSSNCMIDLYSERGMVAQAEEIFEELKQRGDANEFSYAMMLCMYRRVGKVREAIAIADRMRELELLTSKLSYNIVIGLYASDGRLTETVETFWEMIKSNVQPDDSTFRSLGAVLVRCGVSKEVVSKLEVTRRNDFENGLQEWMKTLWSMICVDEFSWNTSCPY